MHVYDCVEVFASRRAGTSRLGKTYLLMPVILCSCSHTHGTMKNGIYYLPSATSPSRASLPSDPSNLIASTINTTHQGDQTHSRR